MQVRELQDGQAVNTVMLVRSAELRHRRDGQQFLKLTLGDRTGCLGAVINEHAARASELFPAGTVVWISGCFSIHPRFGPELEIETIRTAHDGEYEPIDLHDGPAHSAARMESDLRELLVTIQEPYLRRLLGLMFGADSPTWLEFRDAPAAKHYHQAYRHGLLEHSLSVAESVSAIAANFPGIDREVAVTGALLHDVGKLEAYRMLGSAIEMTDEGRLFGEIPLGYYRVRRAIEKLDGFPTWLAEAVLHIILSHHGSLEHGSPVVPCTREATLVHMIDNLGGKLGSFDRVEKALAAGAQWSPYDKGIGGGAFFAHRAESERRAA
jgi:3'-5' exoribonuclease